MLSLMKVQAGFYLVLAGVGTILGLYLLHKFTGFLDFVQEQVKFVTEPVGYAIPVQKPWIPPVIAPTQPAPGFTSTVSGINWLSGTCPTLQKNILDDVALCTTERFYGVLPNTNYNDWGNCAKRVRNYWDKATSVVVKPCNATFADVRDYVAFMSQSYELGDKVKQAQMRKGFESLLEELRRLD